jgi:YebC/PmpR family DNA-binding regulatory protein
MAGHSKWANIKFRKASQDAKRGRDFAKFIREITTAARISGPDPSNNPRLRTVIDKALAANMTRDTIDKAIKRAVGGKDGVQLEEIRYEGYAPGGVAIIVDCLTDNHKRSVADVRHAFTKCAGNLGTNGCVTHLFNHSGCIIINTPTQAVLDALIELGLDDFVENEDGSCELSMPPALFPKISDYLHSQQLAILHEEVGLMPYTTISVATAEQEQVTKLIQMLEDLDDVQAVYTNADLA